MVSYSATRLDKRVLHFLPSLYNPPEGSVFWMASSVAPKPERQPRTLMTQQGMKKAYGGISKLVAAGKVVARGL